MIGSICKNSFYITLVAASLSAAYEISEASTNPVAASSPTNTVSSILKQVFDNPWIQGGFIILLTFIGASLFVWLIFRLLQALVNRTKIELDNQIVLALRPPIYYTLVALGITAGLDLMPMPGTWLLIINRCLQSLGVLVWAVFFIRLASLILNRIAGLSDKYEFIQRRTVTLFDNIAKVIIFGACMYAIFVIWSIDLTAWLASAGIVGIAIGFAAKDTLSNLFSGVFILADTPYRIGDYIVLDTGSRGKVTNIGLRSTRILTRDDIEVTIPNSIIGNTMITNQSGGPSAKMRVRLKIGVAYGSDIDKVKRILLDITQNEQQVCTNPVPRVRFRLFGSSSLDFELLFWVDNPELRGRVLDAVNTKVYKKFRDEGVEIPYSKQDLYIKGLPEQFQIKQGPKLED